MGEELLSTLELARQSLPADAHPVHATRMYLIARIVRRALELEPEYWSDALDQVERIADDVVIRRQQEDDSRE